MLKKIIGYLIVGIGFLGIGFFKTYKGNLIPYPTFWFLISIAIFIVGIGIVYNAKSFAKRKIRTIKSTWTERLRRDGEKITLVMAKCEFKDNSHFEDKADESISKIKAIDGLYDSSRNSFTTKEHTEQSVVIYHHTHHGKTEKFVSQNFPCDYKTLKERLNSNNTVIYVDKNNRRNYFFDADLDLN